MLVGHKSQRNLQQHRCSHWAVRHSALQKNCLSCSLPVRPSISVPTLSLKAACLSLPVSTLPSLSTSPFFALYFFCTSLHPSVCLSVSLSLYPSPSYSLSVCLCQTLLFQWILFKVELMPVKSGGKLLLWSTLNFPLKFHLWLNLRSITSQRVFCSDRWWEEITLTSMIGVRAEVRHRTFQGE